MQQIHNIFFSVTRWLALHWRGLTVGVIIAAMATLTMSLQINTLVDGQNRYETDTLAHLETFPNPFERMINAPFLVPAYLVGNIINNDLLGARFTSVFFGLISTLLLFLLLKRWYNIHIAAVGSLLFITSSWVLAISHQAAPLILVVLAPLLLIVALTKFAAVKGDVFWPFLGLIASLAFAAYVPFMFWPMLVVALAVLILYKKRLRKLSQKQLLIAGGLYAVLLLPMFISIFQYPGQLKELAGIPQQFPGIVEYLQNFVWQFSSLVLISQPFPELYVGRLPLLDVFSAVMLILGIYHFVKFAPRRRRVSLIFLIIVLSLLIPLREQYQIPMASLVAIVYVLIAAGIHELLKQWFSYFPRNPIARNGAVILVAILIGMATLYNMQKFYIAWPSSAETKAAYMVQSNK